MVNARGWRSLATRGTHGTSNRAHFGVSTGTEDSRVQKSMTQVQSPGQLAVGRLDVALQVLALFQCP